MSLSSASNRFVDEALRMHEHPLIAFEDGPAGRRARLVGGPDVREIIGAVRSVRESDPALAGDDVSPREGVRLPAGHGAGGRRHRARDGTARRRAVAAAARLTL